MTTGNPFKIILWFSVPLFIGNMFQQFYSTVDSLIVRQTIGIDAFTAIGSTNSITFLVLGFMLGITAGLSVITAQYYGAGEMELVRKSIATSIIVGTAISIIVTIIAMVYCNKLLEVMQTPDQIFDRTYSYLIVIFGGIFASFIYNFFASTFRALGDSKTPLYFLIFASVLNIILDFILILFVGLDVEGAGYATVFSQLISGVGLFIFARKKLEAFNFVKSDFKLDFEFIKIHINSSVPMGFQYSVIAIGTIVVQIALNQLGTDYITSYIAASRIEIILAQVFPAIGVAVVTFVAQNYGAGKMDRIKNGVKQAMILSTTYAVISGGCIILFNQSMLKVILGTKQPDFIYSNAKIYLIFCGFSFVFLGMILVYRNALQGVSKMRTTVIAGFLELFTRCIVIGFLTAPLGYTGVCLASAFTWVITGLYVFICFQIVVKDLISNKDLI